MFIIEGKQGKSRILEKLVNELPESDCIIIDRIGISSGWNKSLCVFDFKEVSHKITIKWLLSSLGKYITEEKTLVLEVNCNKEELKDYLMIENKLINYYDLERCIITMQNNDIENDNIKIWRQQL
jgi:hypothetical protein